MTTVGSFEAKTHLPQLLERVSRGERITITKHGRPVAMLVPPPAEKADVEETVRKLLEVGFTIVTLVAIAVAVSGIVHSPFVPHTANVTLVSAGIGCPRLPT